ncbi:MAG: low molecular weight phosphotyrosine protein phosphatase, partial [Bacteroidetes bacterium]|nr:low molecular weight phosphotyrosine protein phosphatase [Bacteroidota bacterium]
HCTIIKVDEVPDPYYGGSQGFEHVLDIIEDGCNGLLKRIITVHPEMK